MYCQNEAKHFSYSTLILYKKNASYKNASYIAKKKAWMDVRQQRDMQEQLHKKIGEIIFPTKLISGADI